MIYIEEISNRLLPSAIFIFTDNSVTMKTVLENGQVLSENSYKNIDDASKHYKEICNNVKEQLQENNKKNSSKKVVDNV